MTDPVQSLFTQALADHEAGRLEDAIAGYRAIDAALPGQAVIFLNLGVALYDLHRWEEAIDAFEATLAADPVQNGPYVSLIAILFRLSRYGYAESVAWRMMEYFPDDPVAYLNLSALLTRHHRFATAAHILRQAPASIQDSALYQRNLGCALTGLGGRGAKGAIAAHRRSLAQTPDDPLAHLGLAEVLLRDGQLVEGFQEYRHALELPLLPGREWTGEPLAGRTLLVHKNDGFCGGFGDVIFLSRYVPMAAALGATVTFAVPPAQVTLMRSLGAHIIVVPIGGPMPDCDYHCSLMAMPRLFGTTLEAIPAPIGYLRSPPQKAAEWADRLSSLSGLRVGLIWAGYNYLSENLLEMEDRRAIGLKPLMRLWQEPGIDFVSLQLDEQAREKALLPEGAMLHDFTAHLGDFADTAAAMASLDLIISVDTAGAHLAAALGKPTWIVHAFSCCWRWFHDREDSPWYPTVRLFRQKGPGDWNDVVDALQRRLHAAVQDRGILMP